MRYFAEIVFPIEGSASLGINMLVIDEEHSILYQKAYPNGEQEKDFDRYSFVAGQLSIEWKDGGSQEVRGLREIQEKEAINVLRDGNWERLCIGLRKGSVKTLTWLQSRGFIREDIDVEETLRDRQKMAIASLEKSQGIPDPF